VENEVNIKIKFANENFWRIYKVILFLPPMLENQNMICIMELTKVIISKICPISAINSFFLLAKRHFSSEHLQLLEAYNSHHVWQEPD
jgi:hypothetical protein